MKKNLPHNHENCPQCLRVVTEEETAYRSVLLIGYLSVFEPLRPQWLNMWGLTQPARKSGFRCHRQIVIVPLADTGTVS